MISKVGSTRGYESVGAVGATASASPAVNRGESQVKSTTDRVSLSDEALRLLARDPGPGPSEPRRDNSAPVSEAGTATANPVRQLDTSRDVGATTTVPETDSSNRGVARPAASEA